MNIQKEFAELLNQAKNKNNNFSYNRLPIIIYGAGQMGVDASKCLSTANVKIECFLDKNSDLWSTTKNNILISNPENISAYQKENCLFAISIVTVSYNTIYSYLKSLGCKNICFVGDLINFLCRDTNIASTFRINDISNDETEKLEFVFDNYDDEISRKSMLQFLSWVVKNEEKENYVPVLKMEEKYFIEEIREVLRNDEIFIDYDSFDADSICSIEKFTNGEYLEIYSFEPEENKFLTKNKRIQSNKNRSKIHLYPFGLGKENSIKNYLNGFGLTLTARFTDQRTDRSFPIRSLDELMLNQKYTFLKVYGLGIAIDVIVGALKTIKICRPIISVTIHHKRKDFIEIPNILVKNLDNYLFYLRLHSYCGFETIFYAIPKERKN